MTEAMSEKNEFQALADKIKRNFTKTDDDGVVFYGTITGSQAFLDTVLKSLEFMAANHEAVRDETIERDFGRIRLALEDTEYFLKDPEPTRRIGKVVLLTEVNNALTVIDRLENKVISAAKLSQGD